MFPLLCACPPPFFVCVWRYTNPYSFFSLMYIILFISGSTAVSHGNVLQFNYMHDSRFGDGIFFDYWTLNDKIVGNIASSLFRCIKVVIEKICE